MGAPAPGVPTTLREAVAVVAAAIDAAGVGDTPRLDADLLVGLVSGRDRVGLRIDADAVLAPDAWTRLDQLVGRRCAGEPIAYLLGTQWFWGREFLVDARVLVPRPETELLVERVLEHLSGADAVVTVVDACTGSGCIAVTLAAELAGRGRVHATDIAAGAIEVASTNAARHAVDITLHRGDLLAPVRDLRGVSVVVANPPYVEGPGAAGLEPGVRDFEPHEALFVQDGDVAGIYARLAEQAAAILEPGGLLVVEHGAGQRSLVFDAVTAAGFTGVAGLDDLAGVDRAVEARLPD